jgi:hypothetical protein
MTKLATSALVVVSLLASSPALAEEKQVLVFPLTGHLAKPPGDAVLPRLTQVVARAAGLTGAKVSTSRASFEDGAALAGCAAPEPTCLGSVAEALAVDHVVLGHVEPVAGGSKVVLYAFVNGKLTTREFVLATGSDDQVVEQMARETPAVFVGDKPGAPIEPPPPREDEEKKPTQAPPAAVTPPPRDEGGFRADRVPAGAWWLAGGGAALAAGGAVFLGLAVSKQGEVDDAPTATAADLARLRDLEEEGELYTNVGNGLLVGGGLALVGGGAWILYRGYSSEGSKISLRPHGAGVNLVVELP